MLDIKVLLSTTHLLLALMLLMQDRWCLACSYIPKHHVCSGKVGAIRCLNALSSTAATVHPIPSSFTQAWNRYWECQWLGANHYICLFPHHLLNFHMIQENFSFFVQAYDVEYSSYHSFMITAITSNMHFCELKVFGFFAGQLLTRDMKTMCNTFCC